MTHRGALPTVCVVADNLNQPSETFVRRHVRELNGGNTVAMARSPGGEGAAGKPFLTWRRPGRFRQLIGRYDPRPLLPGMQPDPFGAEFAAFVAAHRVGFMLCEFGPVGIGMHELARAAGIPMFCYFRGYDASRKLSDYAYVNGLRHMLPRIDGIVAVSAFLLEQLASRGLTHPNSMVIPSGVDSRMFEPAEKDPNLVLSVGRMVEKKAPLTTLRAFARVAAQQPSLRLEMIGEGPLRESGVAEAQALNIADRVTFHGKQGHQFVIERLRRAAIYMQHSVTGLNGETEGAPTSIQEAMMAGTAVLSTQHAGIPEIVRDGERGLLVPERDLDAYAAGLSQLATDGALRERMGAAARAYALEELDYRRLYGRLEAAMAAAIAARSR
jgi:colanic acid/amylovoran biosynthesis glycosyltransferase